MNARMHPLPHTLLLAALLPATLLTARPVAARAAAHPNVIIVMTDDQGYGDLSYHGNPVINTRHLDQLADESLRLTDFHVAPMCTPTRGQLLTGLDSFRNRAMNVSSGRTLLRRDVPTIADVFAAAGYRTGIFGKWHLGDNYPYRPQDRGFDESIWFPSSHINSVPDHWDNDYFNDVYWHNGERQKYDGYCTDVFFREAMDWMQAIAADGRPFLTYIPLNAAHWPHFVPDEYRGPIRNSLEAQLDKLPQLNPAQQQALVSFLAMIANIDDNMGRLDSFLQQNGLRDNTIVVFLTDNGSTMGPRYFNAGMKGGKVTLWEGGHRVPCFIRWPGGQLLPPQDIDELSHVQDLLPTLIELCGIEHQFPVPLDGLSLAGLLRGELQELPDRMLVINYSRMPRANQPTPANRATPRREGAAVMWKQWRLLRDVELYNLAEDPHQDRNVIEQYPEVTARMRNHLDKWWDGVRGDASTIERPVIGDNAENPMQLTACEWLDVFVDQQRQIRRADLKNG
ncbi:MAG: arylsulfatase, partial [Maioricimonas sp. JB049]